MTATVRATISTRQRNRKPRWDLGDALTVNSIRYIIRRIDRTTGFVQLEATNTTNHGEWWTTTLDKLPEKRS